MVHTTVWGIGNPLLKDDAAGLEIIRQLLLMEPRGFSLRSCELAPANYLATLKRERPLRFYLADAADMGLTPGNLRRFPLERIADPSLTSHDLPLNLLLETVLESGTRSWVVAVQPEDTGFGTELSPCVAAAVQKAARLIAEGRAEDIPELEEA